MNELTKIDRIEALKNDIEGVVEVANHQVSEIGVRLMYQVGSLILEAAEDLKEEPVKLLQRCKPQINRGDRWLRYSIQTAQKFNEDTLPLKGVHQFIKEDLTKIRKVEIIRCLNCKIHCKK